MNMCMSSMFMRLRNNFKKYDLHHNLYSFPQEVGMNVLDNYSVAFRFVECFCLWLTSQTEVIELDPANVDSNEGVPYDYVQSSLMLR